MTDLTSNNQHVVLARIIQLNNEGAGMLVSSAVGGRPALAVFQQALAMASALVESLYPEGTGISEEPATSKNLHRFYGSATIPLYHGGPRSGRGAGLYFYLQAHFLHPGCATLGSTDATPLTGEATLTARLARVCIPALLMNIALAYYQIGCAFFHHRHRDRSRHFWRKACQIYAEVQNVTMRQPSPFSTSPLAFWNLAALNNICLLRLELGEMEPARQVHAALLLAEGNAKSDGSNEEKDDDLLGLLAQQQSIMNEFSLNALSLTLTGFLQDLGAAVA